jgi:nucleotide-binding universal stress UspA family protein
MAGPFKKILVPTDFSASSARALVTANDLATCFGAELVILHVIPEVPVVVSPPMVDTGALVVDLESYQEEMERDSRARLAQLVTDLTSRSLTVRTKTEYGPAHDRIMNFVRDEQIDLIVISTHGISGFRHFFFGSVAEKVIKSSAVPVLVIRSPKEAA